MSAMTSEEITVKTIISGLSLLTLKEISIMTLAIELLQEEEVKEIYYQDFSAEVNYGLSDSSVHKLTHVCKSLQIPDVLELEVISAFHWIANEYFNWIKYVLENLPEMQKAFSNKLDFISHIMNSVRWTKGAIDKKKSIHQVFFSKNIEDETILKEMFRTASKFCLEDDLTILWEKISEAEKSKGFLNEYGETASKFCLDDDITNLWDKISESEKSKGFLNEYGETASKFCLDDDITILWDKISESEKSKGFLNEYGETCFLTLYWICKMKGDMNDFMDRIPNYLKQQNYYETVKGYNDICYYALVLYTSEGDVSGMKYFNELATVDDQDKMHIIEILLHKDYGPNSYQWVEKLVFWLREIKDESIVSTIMHEYAKEFLKISVKYWPWHKFLLSFLRMCNDSIDQVFVYDLITQLLEDVKIGKADVFQVKTFWKNLPSEVKGSFCVYISNKQELKKVRRFWEIVAVEVFDVFLKDEELRNILTPYENYGIWECVYAGRYDLIEFWLQKCLVSEEAIFLYLNNFMQTKSVAVIKSLQGYPLNRVTQFLDWAFQYEDFTSRDNIWTIKDQAINENIIAMFVRGFELEKWEDLKKLMDWMVRNREHEYENELVNWKKKVMEQFFKETNLGILSSNDFKSSLLDFLSYAVNDPEKIKVMMSKVGINEGQICLEYSTKSDVAWIDNYFKIMDGYGRNVLLIKEKIVSYIFNHCSEADFEKEKFCKNIRKLLYSGCENNQESATNIEKIKITIIRKYALENIWRCVNNKWCTAMCNLLKFLFEGKMEDEEWLMMLFDLKIKVIKQLETSMFGRKNVWNEKEYYEIIIELIDWGKENENTRTWEIKKYFIKCLKNYILPETSLQFILNCNILCSLFKGDEEMPDFYQILWDFKEFLVGIANAEWEKQDDNKITRQLFENFKAFTNFLNWYGYDNASFKNLKIKIIDEKGVNCCLSWFKANKLHHFSDFFSWCLNDNPFCDLKPNILNLKKNVTAILISTNFNHWNDDLFQRLDYFLMLHTSGDEEDLKRIVIENHAAKSCHQCIVNGCSGRLEAFMKWAKIEGDESINNFKRNVLIEFLNVKNINCWNELNAKCVLGFKKFLYGYDNPDPVKITCLKLDVLEVDFFTIFEKLLGQGNRLSSINLLKWSFDVHMKSDECLLRTQILIDEMLEKYGKEYCTLLLSVYDVNAVTDFFKFCLNFKMDVETSNSLLWNLEKHCISQVLSNEIEIRVGEGNWNPSIEIFWIYMNKFMPSGPGSSNLAYAILQYKDFVSQGYGIFFMEKYFKCLLKDSWLKFPKNFLGWLFGENFKMSRIHLNEEKLLNFKKQLLLTLINIKHKDLLKEHYFYSVLEEFLNFNLLPGDEYEVNDLKKNICEVQGITLCIDLMCQNNEEALQRFVRWVKNVFDGSFVDFKLAVVLGLAGNSTHVYSWEPLSFFLQNGFNLNHEIDKQEYSTLKEFLSDLCSVDICYNWIVNRQWEEIPGFLEWCSENQDCKELKLKLLHKHGAEYCNACLMDDDWENLEKFLNWAFGSHENNIEREEEVINLKTETLNSEICYKDHLEILLAFLEWGFTSQDSLNKFKKSILELDHPLNYFVTEEEYKSLKELQLWFAIKE